MLKAASPRPFGRRLDGRAAGQIAADAATRSGVTRRCRAARPPPSRLGEALGVELRPLAGADQRDPRAFQPVSGVRKDLVRPSLELAATPCARRNLPAGPGVEPGMSSRESPSKIGRSRRSVVDLSQWRRDEREVWGGWAEEHAHGDYNGASCPGVGDDR